MNKSNPIFKTSTLVLALGLCLAHAVSAQTPIAIANPSFEDSASGTPVGWTNVNGGGEVFDPTTAQYDPLTKIPDGVRVASIYQGDAGDGISQVLAATFQEGSSYTLTVKVGNPADEPFDGYMVQLLANGTILEQDDNTQMSVAGDFVTSTVSYTYDPGEAALVGQPLEIRLLSKGLNTGDVNFDDVQLTVSLGNPVANPGGPYLVAIPDGSLSLDGSDSLPSDGQTITSWEWDLTNDGNFDDVTGATPAAIDYATLTAALPTGYGMVEGDNTIKLRVTDSADKTSIVEGIVNLSQPLLIYEPFDDLDPTLAGNTPGLGLTGTWTGQSLVAGSSLKYGKLGYQGGRAVTNPANNVDSCGVSFGTTLTDAGLMDNGATLWFSVLIVKHPVVSPATTGRATYFSIGTGAPDGFDRVGGNTGSGFTVVINQTATGTNRDRIQGWNNNSAGSGGAFRSALANYGAEGDTILAVGKITWGEFNVTNDVFELYIPDKDLNLGSPVSTLNGNFDQLGAVNPANRFTTIGFAGNRRENNVPEVDEIRFGATAAAVLPLDFVAPLLASTDNASGSSIERVATFDEEVYIGTGDIRIVNETTPGTTTITLPDPQVVVSGNTLTITPTGGLVSGDTYHIEIDAGALTDRNLNEFAGISDPDLWKFTVDGTPPTVASFGDNTFPKPILTNSSRLVYTVTFDEPIDAGTVGITDFAATAGSVPITIDSVTATGPAVFEVGVTTLGTTGTLALEIVAGAVITDLNGNELDTTTAIPSDNTLTVNDPTPTAASLVTDFQATIASEQHPTYAGEARYFHVSVNPANAGTGSYAATVTGTPDNIPAPVFVRNYTGPVVSYKFAGGANNIVGIMDVGMSGGDADRIIHTTQDPAYDGFAQQQAKVWDATDPGPNLATDLPNPFNAVADKNAGLFRSLGGAIGTIDISGLASGSVHIYYGSFSATPSVRVTMRDLDNVAADIVLNNVHLNGDFANRAEYYLAEIDFVTDGFYDVIEYEWLANGVNYEGNGRGIGTVLTGPDFAVGSPYGAWADTNAPTGTPADDFDNDGVPNAIEFVLGGDKDSNDLGLLPTVATTGGNMAFTFIRDQDSIDGSVSVVIEVSTDLVDWPDTFTVGADTASSSAGVTVTDNSDGTDTITLTITQAPDAKKFARLRVDVAQ